MAIDVDEVFPILLAADATVVATVVDRFYPNRIPQQGKFPAVCWRRISGGPNPKLNGQCSVKRATFQVESWSAESQEEARQLDLAVQAAIAPKLSVQIGSWWIQVIKLQLDTDQDNPQIPIDATDKGLFCSFSEVFTTYRLF